MTLGSLSVPWKAMTDTMMHVIPLGMGVDHSLAIYVDDEILMYSSGFVSVSPAASSHRRL